MITHFNVATRSSTNDAGINLPPVHGIQKGIDPTLKPESQSKSQQPLAQPTLGTPNKRISKPVVRWTPSQTPHKVQIRSSKVAHKANSQSIQKTSVQVQKPVMNRTPISKQVTPSTIGKQTPAEIS